MNGNRIALSFIAIIVFTGLGCRQESPGAPPAAPTPKTSSAPSDPIAAAPATAAQNEKTNSDPGITRRGRRGHRQSPAALLGNEDVRATEINVETQKGVVQLSGVVQTNSDLDRAVYLAKQVEGVKEVQ
ncbi:MAG: BON domain-containing protein, partial [Burkholderiales bacterium]